MKTYQCLNCGTECPVSHQKTNKYCSVSCQQKFQYNSYIIEWKQGINTGSKVNGDISNYVRRYLADKLNSTCSGCGITEWQGKPITLEIEHIDGCGTNHTEDNMTLLCPNCHSQTDTYKSKNRGKGRHSRRVRYAEGKSY